MIIRLVNEDGEETYWDVDYTTSPLLALQEAWRAYRDLNHIDHEMPPPWADAACINPVKVSKISN